MHAVKHFSPWEKAALHFQSGLTLTVSKLLTDNYVPVLKNNAASPRISGSIHSIPDS